MSEQKEPTNYKYDFETNKIIKTTHIKRKELYYPRNQILENSGETPEDKQNLLICLNSQALIITQQEEQIKEKDEKLNKLKEWNRESSERERKTHIKQKGEQEHIIKLREEINKKNDKINFLIQKLEEARNPQLEENKHDTPEHLIILKKLKKQLKEKQKQLNFKQGLINKLECTNNGYSIIHPLLLTIEEIIKTGDKTSKAAIKTEELETATNADKKECIYIKFNDKIYDESRKEDDITNINYLGIRTNKRFYNIIESIQLHKYITTALSNLYQEILNDGTYENKLKKIKKKYKITQDKNSRKIANLKRVNKELIHKIKNNNNNNNELLQLKLKDAINQQNKAENETNKINDKLIKLHRITDINNRKAEIEKQELLNRLNKAHNEYKINLKVIKKQKTELNNFKQLLENSQAIDKYNYMDQYINNTIYKETGINRDFKKGIKNNIHSFNSLKNVNEIIKKDFNTTIYIFNNVFKKLKNLRLEKAHPDISHIDHKQLIININKYISL